ncbi:hypothetical protein [Sphaerisporangium fuscum]|uniref:hypothetical protein n=1 Tax=Sphaerisporangium fuscum TaxID=2835868 RepID=UPI001BDD4BE8|nr:hypothetical protein [Sphaerisporangium fuscum]
MKYQELYDELTSGTVSRGLRRWVLCLLDDIAAGRSPIKAVRHPLGFVCLPVERGGENGVCVHLWSGELRRAGRTTSDVHCHSWDLVSYILYGQVRNEIATVDDDGAATHRVLEVVSAGDVDSISPTGRLVRYIGGVSGTYGAGEVYSLPAGVFHRSVIPEGTETATIALGSGRAGASDLSLGPLDTRPHRVTRQRCDDEETARAARLAAEHMART